jgi:hypothetical protein
MRLPIQDERFDTKRRDETRVGQRTAGRGIAASDVSTDFHGADVTADIKAARGIAGTALDAPKNVDGTDRPIELNSPELSPPPPVKLPSVGTLPAPASPMRICRASPDARQSRYSTRFRRANVCRCAISSATLQRQSSRHCHLATFERTTNVQRLDPPTRHHTRTIAVAPNDIAENVEYADARTA